MSPSAHERRTPPGLAEMAGPASPLESQRADAVSSALRHMDREERALLQEMLVHLQTGGTSSAAGTDELAQILRHVPELAELAISATGGRSVGGGRGAGSSFSSAGSGDPRGGSSITSPSQPSVARPRGEQGARRVHVPEGGPSSSASAGKPNVTRSSHLKGFFLCRN